MALNHAQPCQAIEVAPLGPRLHDASTHAILKTHALELIRVVLQRGDRLPPHHVRGELTLQCIEGEVELDLGDARCELSQGHMVLLPAGARHGVRALQDSSLLLTIQIPPGEPGSASATQ